MSWELYDAVTDFVSTKLREIRGDRSKTTAGFALTTMQRRVASSTRAIRGPWNGGSTGSTRRSRIPAAYLRRRKAFQATLFADADDLDDLDEEPAGS